VHDLYLAVLGEIAGQTMPSDRLMICRKSCGVVTLRTAASRRGTACSVRTSMATTGPYHRVRHRQSPAPRAGIP